MHRYHKRIAVSRQETGAVPPKPVASPDDDDDFDIGDIFDVFGDDDDPDSAEESAEDDEEDDDVEEDDDDDDGNGFFILNFFLNWSIYSLIDEAEFDESDEVEEAEPDADDADAFDLIADLLEDDEVTPKPTKPASTSAVPPILIQQIAEEEPEPEVIADEQADSVEEVVEQAPVRISIQKVPETTSTAPTKAPTKKQTKPTSKKVNPTKTELPLLNLQNTPALLELQAQLTSNNNNAVKLEPESPPKPIKNQKKKKQKGTVKKQSAISTNEISELESGPVEKTLLVTESPVYMIEIHKKPHSKPEVTVEGPKIMEKVHLKLPESEKNKIKPIQDTLSDDEDLEYEEEQSTMITET